MPSSLALHNLCPLSIVSFSLCEYLAVMCFSQVRKEAGIWDSLRTSLSSLSVGLVRLFLYSLVKIVVLGMGRIRSLPCLVLAAFVSLSFLSFTLLF